MILYASYMNQKALQILFQYMNLKIRKAERNFKRSETTVETVYFMK